MASKKMIHIEVDNETFLRLQELAFALAKERGNFRIGLQTVVRKMIEESLDQHGVAGESQANYDASSFPPSEPQAHEQAARRKSSRS